MDKKKETPGEPCVRAAKAALDYAKSCDPSRGIEVLDDGITALEMLIGMGRAMDAYEMAIEFQQTTHDLIDCLATLEAAFRGIKNEMRTVARSEDQPDLEVLNDMALEGITAEKEQEVAK